jgi:hypothetical protein
MPGALVFPGGLVDSADEKFSPHCLSRKSQRNITGDLLQRRVCGARELFEVRRFGCTIGRLPL